MDKKMSSIDRKIALIVDNCRAHPIVPDLTNIKLFFLPPNTTARTQPMDAWVIRNLKFHYKSKLVNRRLDAFDLGREFSIDLYEAVSMLNNSWVNEVSPRTIANCFLHAHFQPDAKNNDEPEIAEEIPANIFERMQALYGDVDFNEYVQVDDNIITFEEQTDDQIVRNVMNLLP